MKPDQQQKSQEPPKPKYLELSPEDLEKVNRNRAKREAVQIDEEQLFIAEFGMLYGFEGIKAILNNEIDSETAVWLLLAGRKMENLNQYKRTQAAFIGAAAAKAKKPSAAFKKSTDKMLKNSKADI